MNGAQTQAAGSGTRKRRVPPFQIALSETIDQGLAKLAAQRGLTKTEIVRAAIVRDLVREGMLQ